MPADQPPADSEKKRIENWALKRFRQLLPSFPVGEVRVFNAKTEDRSQRIFEVDHGASCRHSVKAAARHRGGGEGRYEREGARLSVRRVFEQGRLIKVLDVDRLLNDE